MSAPGSMKLPTSWNLALSHYPWEAKAWMYGVLRGERRGALYMYGERESGKTFYARMLELVTIVRAIPEGGFNDGVLDAVVLYTENPHLAEGYLDNVVSITRKGLPPLRVENRFNVLVTGQMLEDCPIGAAPLKLKQLGGKRVDQWSLIKDLRGEVMDLLREVWN